MQSRNRGFTLIEVLVVIGIIAVLAAIVLVALNPSRQFAQARNSQRTSNVTTILNAIGQRIADNKGVFEGTFEYDGTAYTCPAIEEGEELRIASSGADSVSLACLTPTYIPSQLPVDPKAAGATWTSASAYDTGYTVEMDAGGRFTVSAPGAELGEEISATR